VIREFEMKTFATILFAVCVFSRLASSVEWDDLYGDAINAIGSKLDASGKIMFSVTSSVVGENVQVSPREILEHVVNSNNFLWDQIEMLLRVKKSSTSKDAFVVKRNTDAGSVPDLTESVEDELSQWTAALLSATKDEESRLKIFDRREKYSHKNKNVSYGSHVNIYVVWDKYSPSEIAACINDAHDKLMKECFVDGKITNRCAVYFFACGFQLENHRNHDWIVGESNIFT